MSDFFTAWAKWIATIIVGSVAICLLTIAALALATGSPITFIVVFVLLLTAVLAALVGDPFD